MEATRRRELWIWRAAWFCVIVSAVAIALPVVRTLSKKALVAQTTRELQNLQRMLAAFRDRHGGWPRIYSPDQLILALRGRMNADGKLTRQEPSFLLGAQLYFRDGKFEGPDSALIDAWGNPYIYVYVHPFPGRSESYVLASAGPDGKASPQIGWFPGENGSRPEDADNLWARPDGAVRSGAGLSLKDIAERNAPK